MKIRINNNHWAGLAYGILGWILGWYSLVLTAADYQDEKTFPLSPTSTQYVGIAFAVTIAIFSWLQRIFSIQGDETEQG